MMRGGREGGGITLLLPVSHLVSRLLFNSLLDLGGGTGVALCQEVEIVINVEVWIMENGVNCLKLWSGPSLTGRSC